MNKDVIRILLVLAVVWVGVKWWGKYRNKTHHKSDPTQFSQASRAWFPSLVNKANAEPFSVQPQSALY